MQVDTSERKHLIGAIYVHKRVASVLCISMQYMTALVMANMHCDILRILAAVKYVVYLTMDVR